MAERPAPFLDEKVKDEKVHPSITVVDMGKEDELTCLKILYENVYGTSIRLMSGGRRMRGVRKDEGKEGNEGNIFFFLFFFFTFMLSGSNALLITQKMFHLLTFV